MAGDVVSRLGGEEFAVLAPETDETEGFLLAERLRAEVKTAFAREPAHADDQLRRGELSRPRDHLGRAPPGRRAGALRGQGAAAGTARVVFSPAARRPASEREKVGIERTSSEPRLADVAGGGGGSPQGRARQLPSRGRLRRALARRLGPPRGGRRAGAGGGAASRRGRGGRGRVDPRQAGPADRGGAARGSAPSEHRRAHRRRRAARAGGRMDPQPPRVPGRQRLSARPAGSPDPARGQDPRGRRRVRGDDRSPAVPEARSRRSARSRSFRRGRAASSTTRSSRRSCR